MSLIYSSIVGLHAVITQDLLIMLFLERKEYFFFYIHCTGFMDKDFYFVHKN